MLKCICFVRGQRERIGEIELDPTEAIVGQEIILSGRNYEITEVWPLQPNTDGFIYVLNVEEV